MNNSKIAIDHLQLLSELYFKTDETARASTFSSAVLKLKETYPAALPDDLSELRKIKGIGPSTIKEIESALSIGTSPRLIELQNRDTSSSEETSKSLDKLKSLLGRK